MVSSSIIILYMSPGHVKQVNYTKAMHEKNHKTLYLLEYDKFV